MPRDLSTGAFPRPSFQAWNLGVQCTLTNLERLCLFGSCKTTPPPACPVLKVLPGEVFELSRIPKENTVQHCVLSRCKPACPKKGRPHTPWGGAHLTGLGSCLGVAGL